MRKILLVFLAATILFAACAVQAQEQEQQYIPPELPPTPGATGNAITGLVADTRFSPQDAEFISSSGFAPPWDVFNNNHPIMNPQLNSDGQLTILVQYPRERPAVTYATAYIYNTQAGWQSFRVDGAPVPGLPSFRQGDLVLRPPPNTVGEGVHYIAAYLCPAATPIENSRQSQLHCGCQSRGDCGYWNVQRVIIGERTADDTPEPEIPSAETPDQPIIRENDPIPQDQNPLTGSPCTIPFGGPDFACPTDFEVFPDASPPYVRFFFFFFTPGELIGIPRNIHSNTWGRGAFGNLDYYARYHPVPQAWFFETRAPTIIVNSNIAPHQLWEATETTETIDWVAVAPGRLFSSIYGGSNTILENRWIHPNLRTQPNQVFVIAEDSQEYSSREELDSIFGVRIAVLSADDQEIRIEHAHTSTNGLTISPLPHRSFPNGELILEITPVNIERTYLRAGRGPHSIDRVHFRTSGNGEISIDEEGDDRVEIPQAGIRLRLTADQANDMFSLNFDDIYNQFRILLNFTPESQAPSQGETVPRMVPGSFRPDAIAFTPVSGGWFLGSRALSGGFIARSQDGVIWNRVPGSPTGITQMVANGDTILAAGSAGAFVSSDAGMTWTEASSDFRVSSGQRIVASGGYFVRIPDLHTSEDGLTSRTIFGSPPSGTLRAFAASGNEDAVVSMTGRALFRRSGSQWVEIIHASSSSTGRLIHTGEEYMAIYGTGQGSGDRGDGTIRGPIVTSADGITWERQLARHGNEGSQYFIHGKTLVGERVLYSRGDQATPRSAWIGSGNDWNAFPLVSLKYAYGNGLVVGTNGVRRV